MKRIISIVTAIFLILSIGAMGAVSASAEEKTVEYSYYNGSAWIRGEQSATVLSADSTAWNEGWYVAEGEVTIANRITVSGDVHLILADGATLTASKGITVNSPNALSVYGQAMGTGTINAGGDGNSAAIGGSGGRNGSDVSKMSSLDTAFNGTPTNGGSGSAAGTINIHGGTVNASSTDSAAIGGGAGGIGGSYTVMSGASDYDGAGNGANGGMGGSGAALTVYGGAVNASSANATAIGGGVGGKGGNTGGSGNRGGNGGAGGNGGTVVIYGGEVNADSVNSVAIGYGTGASGGGNSVMASGVFPGMPGSDGDAVTVTVFGGKVKATGGISAIAGAPITDQYTGVALNASTSYDGTGAAEYDILQNSDYKYIEIVSSIEVTLRNIRLFTDGNRQANISNLKDIIADVSRITVTSGATLTGSVITVDEGISKVEFTYLGENGEKYAGSFIPVSAPASGFTVKDGYWFYDGINTFIKAEPYGLGEPELRVTEDGMIQWKNTGESTWRDLLPLSQLTGEQGVQGIQGNAGVQGAQGVQGVAGVQGAQGEKGESLNGGALVVFYVVMALSVLLGNAGWAVLIVSKKKQGQPVKKAE